MRRLGVLFVLALAGLVLSTPAAVAEGYLDEASQGLQTSKVYVSVAVRSVSPTAQASLAATIGSSSVGVVVLPDAASSEVGDGQEFIRELIGRSANKTMLVVVGNRFMAGSSSLEPSDITSVVAQAQALGLPAGLERFASDVKNLEARAPAPMPTDQAPSAEPGWSPVIVGVIVATIGLLVVAAVVTRGQRRRHSGGSSGSSVPPSYPSSPPPTSSPGGFVSTWDNEFPGKPGTGSGG